ncbi:MAG: TM2 domain-containing protein [Bacteroidetes bacterium]|nr:TM2 domain-containing protein [Bacteroidota bacterium]
MTTLLAFIGIAGVNRFYLGQVGMGLAYLFTAGFCLIGTIVDIFNYRSLTTAFNEKQAIDVGMLIHGAFPNQLPSGDEKDA